MSDVTTIELAALLPPETLERLQAEAARQQTPLPNLVREATEHYLDDDEEYEDTPNEQIIADLKQALGEAMAGKTRPAREALAEIRKEIARDADQS